MKRPAFMEGTAPVKVEALKIADVDPAHVRPVKWLPSAPPPPRRAEPVPAPLPVAPPPEPVAAPAPRFEPLESAPAVPAPPPPAITPVASIETIRFALEALRAQGERLAEQARSDALELGVLIARRILEKEVSTNLDSLFSLIKSAIRRAGEDHVTRVRLHPADVERLAGVTDSAFSLGKIELVADASLTRGDVMVDTSHHSVDGRLATRFEELVRQLDGSAP
ncbi:MAG: FliH/SctL family protein [Myxococcota bacterium]